MGSTFWFSCAHNVCLSTVQYCLDMGCPIFTCTLRQCIAFAPTGLNDLFRAIDGAPVDVLGEKIQFDCSAGLLPAEIPNIPVVTLAREMQTKGQVAIATDVSLAQNSDLMARLELTAGPQGDTVGVSEYNYAWQVFPLSPVNGRVHLSVQTFISLLCVGGCFQCIPHFSPCVCFCIITCVSGLR